MTCKCEYCQYLAAKPCNAPPRPEPLTMADVIAKIAAKVAK
jgi:hypothetical protein